MINLPITQNSPEALRRTKMNIENYQIVLREQDCKGDKASPTTLEIGALGHSLASSHSDP